MNTHTHLGGGRGEEFGFRGRSTVVRFSLLTDIGGITIPLLPLVLGNQELLVGHFVFLAGLLVLSRVPPPHPDGLSQLQQTSEQSQSHTCIHVYMYSQICCFALTCINLTCIAKVSMLNAAYIVHVHVHVHEEYLLCGHRSVSC